METRALRRIGGLEIRPRNSNVTSQGKSPRGHTQPRRTRRRRRRRRVVERRGTFYGCTRFIAHGCRGRATARRRVGDFQRAEAEQ